MSTRPVVRGTGYPAGRPRPRPRPRPRRPFARSGPARLPGLIVVLAVLAAGCASPDPEAAVGVPDTNPRIVPGRTSSLISPAPREAPFSWVTVPATGDVVRLQVPNHVHGLLVSVAGAQGGGPGHDLHQAWGAQAEGMIRVQPQDHIQIAVGSQGGGADPGGPGAGGWSMPGFEGGAGGTGHGLYQQGGAGGGGASVITLNGDLALVAGGGGGRGGSPGIAPGTFGGSAGVDRAGDGGTQPELPEDATAYGGSPQHPDNNPTGSSVSTSYTFAGGGGGGGGHYLGRGGSQGRPLRSSPDYPTAGFGGGGGTSYASPATADVEFHVDVDGKNGGGGHSGDGVVRYRWLTDVTFYTFQKIGAPGIQLMQSSPGTSRNQDGAGITTGHRLTDDTGNPVRSQIWRFQTDDTPAEGTLTNLDTGMCLEVDDRNMVDQWHCDDQRNQRWRIRTASDDTVAIALVDPSRAEAPCVAISGHPADVSDGTRITLYFPPGEPQTTWNANIVS